MIDTVSFEASLENALKAFREFSIEASSEVEKALTTAAIKVEGDAKRNISSHVDTGRLMGSITHRLVKDGGQTFAEIGTNVEYAKYVEFGTGAYEINGNGRKTPWVFKGSDGKYHFTRGMHPVLFLTKAYESNRQSIKDCIARAVKKAAENAGR